ncbi:MAG: hypothetical protein ABI196_13680 [Bradyrhizobium sp.]
MSQLATAGSAWRPLLGVDPPRLSEARQQAHHAIQWLARTARAYLPSQPDDGHTNLGWDDSENSFATLAMHDGTRLCLNLGSLTLVLHCGGNNALQFPLDGHTDRQARQWLGEVLGARGLDPNLVDAPSPYAIPVHALTESGRYDAADVPHALAELAAWFANAESSLSRIQEQLIERKFAASEVRCWPHHFDLATLASLPARDGETGYVGVGLSPGDGYYDEPYFYVSVYPKPDPATLPELPALGWWHTRDFTAGVAPAHQIMTAKSPKIESEGFLSAAVEASIKILGKPISN